MSELLPCPFCLQQPTAVTIEGAGYTWVGCDNPKCPASSIACDPDEWNTRTPSDAAVRDAWLPIETADKDQIGFFWMEWADDIKPHGQQVEERIFKGCRGCWSSIYKATHWMPLPAPPLAARTGELQ